MHNTQRIADQVCHKSRTVRSRLAIHLWALLAILLSLSSAPALAAPQVLVTIKPIHSLVAGVMRGIAEPTLMIDGATSPHDFSLKPSQAVALQNADVIFWVGPALESSLVKAIDSIAAGKQVVGLLENKSLVLHELRTHDDFAHGHSHSHGSHSEAIDPHLWLDPKNAIAMVRHIAAALARHDPANATAYQANAKASHKQLESLLGQTQQLLQGLTDKNVLVFHDAYQYFEKRFGLQVAAAVNLDPEVPVSAQRIRTLKLQLRDENIVCAFSEPQYDDRRMAAVIEGTQVRLGTFDPMGASIAAGPDHYEALIQGLADSMHRCLSD